MQASFCSRPTCSVAVTQRQMPIDKRGSPEIRPVISVARPLSHRIATQCRQNAVLGRARIKTTTATNRPMPKRKYGNRPACLRGTSSNMTLVKIADRDATGQGHPFICVASGFSFEMWESHMGANQKWRCRLWLHKSAYSVISFGVQNCQPSFSYWQPIIPDR